MRLPMDPHPDVELGNVVRIPLAQQLQAVAVLVDDCLEIHTPIRQPKHLDPALTEHELLAHAGRKRESLKVARERNRRLRQRLNRGCTSFGKQDCIQLWRHHLRQLPVAVAVRMDFIEPIAIVAWHAGGSLHHAFGLGDDMKVVDKAR